MTDPTKPDVQQDVAPQDVGWSWRQAEECIARADKQALEQFSQWLPNGFTHDAETTSIDAATTAIPKTVFDIIL